MFTKLWYNMDSIEYERSEDMFELTNEQRKCFAIPLVLDSWKRVEVKASPYDHYVTYAFLDGSKIVKVIQVSDTAGREMYKEFGVEQVLSEDGTKILPKTDKGKPQNFKKLQSRKKRRTKFILKVKQPDLNSFQAAGGLEV